MVALASTLRPLVLIIFYFCNEYIYQLYWKYLLINIVIHYIVVIQKNKKEI